jgi:hypothetical protein
MQQERPESGTPVRGRHGSTLRASANHPHPADPALLTTRIGNSSLSGVESGFPVITEPLRDHDYFPYDYVLGRKGPHRLRLAARCGAGQPASA